MFNLQRCLIVNLFVNILEGYRPYLNLLTSNKYVHVRKVRKLIFLYYVVMNDPN